MNFDDISKLRKIVSNWASDLSFNFRIYLYGSQIKGLEKDNSDIDIALEILDIMSDDERMLLWFDNHKQWENILSEKMDMKVDLQLFEGDKTPFIKSYLRERSIILLESSHSRNTIKKMSKK